MRDWNTAKSPVAEKPGFQHPLSQKSRDVREISEIRSVRGEHYKTELYFSVHLEPVINL